MISENVDILPVQKQDFTTDVNLGFTIFFKTGPYPSKSFKGCLPQILLGPLLNTLF